MIFIAKTGGDLPKPSVFKGLSVMYKFSRFCINVSKSTDDALFGDVLKFFRKFFKKDLTKPNFRVIMRLKVKESQSLNFSANVKKIKTVDYFEKLPQRKDELS